MLDSPSFDFYNSKIVFLARDILTWGRFDCNPHASPPLSTRKCFRRAECQTEMRKMTKIGCMFCRMT